MAGDGESLFDNLHAWHNEREPDFLARLHQLIRKSSPRGSLREYLDHGDRGFWIALAYKDRTGRSLVADVEAIVRRWLADLQSDRSRQVMWLSSDPGATWQPISDDQLSLMMPLRSLSVDALRPLLHNIAHSIIDFGGELHRVRVFVRATPVADAAEGPIAVMDRGSKRLRRGGRPPVLYDAVRSGFEALSAKDRELSNSKLADIWATDRSRPGQMESVRQIIGRLRRELIKPELNLQKKLPVSESM